MLHTVVSSMGAKDALTFLVSAVSLLVSLAVGLHTIRSKRIESLKAARQDFEETVEGLINLKIEREQIRHQLSDDWGLNKYSAMRVGFNDKRQLLLSKAKFLLLKYPIDATEVAYVIVGGNISDLGEHAQSLEYYQQALKVAQTSRAKAFSRRLLGRALILSGQLSDGRQQMLIAEDELASLIEKPGFDADVMRTDRAETRRRLLWAELEMRERTHAQKDIEVLSEAILSIRDPERRKPLEKARDELREKALEGVKI